MNTLRSGVPRSLCLLALTVTLAACGNQSPVALTSSQDLVSLTLRSDSVSPLTASALMPQGVPFNDDGTPAVQSVRVQVFNNAGDDTGPLIRFDRWGNQSSNGIRDYIELTPESTTATIRLLPGTYDFESTGLTQNNGGVALAYQYLRAQPINGIEKPPEDRSNLKPGEVNIHLKTLIGRVKLEPSLPLNYVLPGQVFDLNLVVQTPDAGGGKRYSVPLADFTYLPISRIPEFGLEVVSSSQLGSRVRVVQPPTNPSPGAAQPLKVSLLQRVVGLRSDLKFTTRPAYQVLPSDVSFEIPLYPTTTLGVDLTRPTLRVFKVQEFRSVIAVGGRVDDNVGIAKIQVYEGVVLLGSTDAEESRQPGVERISFQTGSYSGNDYNWNGVSIDAAKKRTLTVVAQDTSGNETRVTESFLSRF